MSTPKRRMAGVMGLAAMVALSALIVAVAPSRATFRGPNGLIVFSQQAGEHRQLFTIRPDGTALTQITRLRGDASSPAWSPDGERITFDADLGNRASINTIRFDGTDLRELTPTGFQGQPSYAPDGRWIVFERDISPTNNGVWRMRADGTKLRRVTRNPFATGSGCGCDTDPAFSPDGKRVSFVRIKSEQRGLAAIFTVRLDGRGLRQVTPWRLDAAIKHDWRPDGKLIVFSSYGEPHPGLSSNVFTVRPDGAHLKQLTRYRGGRIHAFAGSWSPNGKQILSRTDASGRSTLSVMNADGSGVRQLTSAAADPRSPSWGTHR
jgi:TolB protein